MHRGTIDNTSKRASKTDKHATNTRSRLSIHMNEGHELALANMQIISSLNKSCMSNIYTYKGAITKIGARIQTLLTAVRFTLNMP